MAEAYGKAYGVRHDYFEFSQLPREKHSYLLHDWDQGLAVEVPWATVNTTLARILGFTQSVHTLERNQREMAAAVADFWQERPTPAAEQEGALLVCTADGKGVPKRGAAEAAHKTEAPSSGGMRKERIKDRKSNRC